MSLGESVRSVEVALQKLIEDKEGCKMIQDGCAYKVGEA